MVNMNIPFIQISCSKSTFSFNDELFIKAVGGF